MAVATYLRAIDAGVAVLDTAHAPLAFATSQPAVETIVAMLRDTDADPGLNLEAIEQVSAHFDKVKTERCVQYDRIVDEMVIVHQIPGGMASNLVSQLKEQKAADRLKEVLEEVPKVRKDLGYPPLVTPTSQMVGVQAVFNVLSGGRYKVVPNEVRDYVKGLYGRSPAPLKDEIRKKILGNEAPITVRPADLLEPVMDKVRKELPRELAQKDEDYISYALFPEVALKFFNWRKNPVVEVKPAVQPAAPKKSAVIESRSDVGMVRELMELISRNDVSEIEWEQEGSRVKIRRATSHAQPAPAAAAPAPVAAPKPVETAAPVAAPPEPAPQPRPEPPKAEPAKGLEEIKSPMVGTFYLRSRPDSQPFAVKDGIVEPGQTLCIIEAMKLMNEIEAEKKCRVVEILPGEGDAVEYGQVLFRVEPL
jgi:oxaloacetate decarboxylase alpha subunit